MAEPVVLSSLLVTAFRLTVKRRWHIVFIALLGLVAVTGYILTENFLITPQEEMSDINQLLAWLSDERTRLFTLGLIALGVVMLEALVRGPLLLVLEETLLGEAKNGSRPRPSATDFMRGAATSFTISLIYVCVTFLLVAAVFSPVWLAAEKNQAALPGIFQLSLFFFIGLSILFYFIKEFSLLYALLGRISLKSALELGYALFCQHITASLLFGALVLGLSFIFTFVLDSAIIISAVLGNDSLFSKLIPVFLLSGIFGVFEQLLRLLFFHQLAAPKEKDKVPQKVTTPEEVSEPVV